MSTLVKPRPSEAVAQHRLELLELIKSHGVTNPRVFGSVARGEDGPDSDLDLLVDRTPGTGLMTLAALDNRAEALLGVPVDIHTPESLKDHIRERVMKEAKPL